MNKKVFVLLTAMVLSLGIINACGNSQDPVEDNDGNNTASNSETQVDDGASDQTGTSLVYGTSTLTYAEFYAGDVSSTDSFDAVSSATNSKYQIMANMATDFVDENTNADGYHITGVQNVNVAVAEEDLEAYKSANPTFTVSEDVPKQYKTVTMDNEKAVYSETAWNVADTVTDAKAELVTGGNWGDYQINVTDGATTHLRNTREDEFDINSQIQGIILETESGLKVGMEYLQSIWVQPYEVSWNVPEDNSHNTHIAAFDNLPELSKLTGETVTKITYIMPDSAYIYEFEGIYIKPIYSGSITATVSEGYDAVTLSTSDFASFENGTLTVTYTLGSGRNREVTTLLETALTNGTDTYALDVSAIADAETGGVYAATISSDTYADLAVSLPMTADQRAALEAALDVARTKLADDPENERLSSHITEGEKLLANATASSLEAGSLIQELTQMTSDEEQAPSGEGGHGGEN